MSSEYEDRKRLTFDQAEGAEPLPRPLNLKEVSTELRARLWTIIHRMLAGASIGESVHGPILCRRTISAIVA
jgi:hypothetical protein